MGPSFYYTCYLFLLIIQVKQRARSLTPDWSTLSSRTDTGSAMGLSSESRDDEMSYVRSKLNFVALLLRLTTVAA